MPLPIRPLGCVTSQKEKKEEKKREGASLLLLLYLVGDTVFHPPSSLISIVYPLAHHLACSLRIASSCERRLDRTAILNRATPNNVLFMIKFLLESYNGKKKAPSAGKGGSRNDAKGMVKWGYAKMPASFKAAICSGVTFCNGLVEPNPSGKLSVGTGLAGDAAGAG